MQDTFADLPKRKANVSLSIASMSGSALKTADGTIAEDKAIYFEQSSGSKVISIDGLYDAKESSPELAQALDLLSEAKQILEEAKAAAVHQNIIESDRSLMQFQARLPGLFSCRKLGDGFGNVINSIMIALVNKRGIPLDLKDIVALWRIIGELRQRPFLSFESSVELIEELEEVGFAVDPSALHYFLEASDE